MGAPDFSYYQDHFESPVAQPIPEISSSSLSDPLSGETANKRVFANLNASHLDTYLVFEVVSEDEIEVNNQVRRIVGSKRVGRHRRGGQSHKTLPLPPTPAFSFKCAVTTPLMADADGKEIQASPAQLPILAPVKCEPQADAIDIPLPSQNQLHLRLDVDMSSVN